LQRFHGDNSGGKQITNSNVGQRARQANACVVDKTTVSVVPGNARVGLHSHVTKVCDGQVQTGVMTVSTANSNSLSELITAPVKTESDGKNCTEPTIRAHVCDVMVNDDVMLNCDINIDTHKQTNMFDASEVIVLHDRNELQYMNVCVMDDDRNIMNYLVLSTVELKLELQIQRP